MVGTGKETAVAAGRKAAADHGSMDSAAEVSRLIEVVNQSVHKWHY